MEAKDRRPENPCKRYVKVRADFELDGRIRPLLFREEDGPAFRIDRVLDVRQGRVAQGGAGRESAMYARWRAASPSCSTTSRTWFIEREESMSKA